MKKLYKVSTVDLDSFEEYEIVRETEKTYFIKNYYSFDLEKEKRVPKNIMEEPWFSDLYGQVWFTRKGFIESMQLMITMFYINLLEKDNHEKEKKLNENKELLKKLKKDYEVKYERVSNDYSVEDDRYHLRPRVKTITETEKEKLIELGFDPEYFELVK